MTCKPLKDQRLPQSDDSPITNPPPPPPPPPPSDPGAESQNRKRT